MKKRIELLKYCSDIDKQTIKRLEQEYNSLLGEYAEVKKELRRITMTKEKEDFKISIDRSKWTAEWIHDEADTSKGKLLLPSCSCSKCGECVQREAAFCPCCGRAMNVEALEELKRRMGN